MPLSVPLVKGKIFSFAEMWGFSPFGLYLRETAQRVRSSASRYSVNRMRITEKQFAVWRLLQNMPAKSLRFLAVLVVPKMGTDHFIRMSIPAIYEVTGLIAAYIRTGNQFGNQSRQSSGTYVHCEASVNSFICGLATASMPIKAPHPAPCRIGDRVAVFQIVLAAGGHQRIAETAAF